MSSLRQNALLLAMSVSSLVNLATAQIPTLETPAPRSAQVWQFGENGTDYNASASYQVPGLNYPETRSTNWTYNAAISLIDDIYQRTIWIDTPDNTDIESQVLPYRGCLSVLGIVPVEQGQTNNGDCSARFDEADVCDQIVENDVLEACQQYVGNDWKGADGHSYSVFGNNTYPTAPTVSDVSPVREKAPTVVIWYGTAA
ncbi:MAG: hypothetical protein Q9221_008214 [Calogaya cf. arnoldii]